MQKRLEQQVRFIIEIDKMKTIFRQTLLMDRSRRENDAEHSWHLAMTAMLLYEHVAPQGVDLCRVLKMALLHDLVEIYAGDTFAYDPGANADKAQRETLAAARLFQLLPEDQGRELHALWEEFDRMETPDAQYAAAIDRLLPLISNYLTEGHTWKLGAVSSAQVYERVEIIRQGAPALWPLVVSMIQESIQKGYLKE